MYTVCYSIGTFGLQVSYPMKPDGSLKYSSGILKTSIQPQNLQKVRSIRYPVCGIYIYVVICLSLSLCARVRVIYCIHTGSLKIIGIKDATAFKGYLKRSNTLAF